MIDSQYPDDLGGVIIAVALFLFAVWRYRIKPTTRKDN